MKRPIPYYIVYTLLLLLLAGEATAGDSNNKNKKLSHIVSVDFRPAYIFQTKDFFMGNNQTQKKLNTTLAGHLKYGFKFGPDTYFGQIYPHAIQGIGVGYNTFFNSTEIGNPLAIYAFQTSRIATLSPKLSMDYEWNFGASFGWKKYNLTHNSYNTVMGSDINAYIYLGLMLNWQITPATHLHAGAGITHYSNGNTHYPNSGLNTIGGTVTLSHVLGYQNSEPAIYQREETFHPYVSYDLIVYGASRKKGIFPENEKPMLVPGRFGIVGLNFNPLYNFNPYFRSGLSIDAQYDESANILPHLANPDLPSNAQELRFYRPPFKEQFAIGLSARAEIVMPIFSINIGIGKNIICKGKDTHSFYQVFVLKTNITRYLFIHTGYQLYRFKEPNNLMLGLGYRFNAHKR